MVTRIFKALAGCPALIVSVSALAHFPDSSLTFPDVREVPKPAVSRCSNIPPDDDLLGRINAVNLEQNKLACGRLLM